MSGLHKNPDFITRNVAGEALLVPVARARADLSEVLVLEGIGGTVWSLLDELHSERDLLAAILDEYEVDEATAAADLRAFLEELGRLGALVAEDGVPDRSGRPEGTPQ